MINIFYPGGMFGSTVEFCLRNFTNGFPEDRVDTDNAILPDGSLHSYQKFWHPVASTHQPRDKNYKISTPIYPSTDGNFAETFQRIASPGDYNIVIHGGDKLSLELNLLFQYYKIAYGVFSVGLQVFSPDTVSENFARWNPAYTRWSDLTRWEYREWFSINYCFIFNDYRPLLPKGALSVVNTDILKDPVAEIKRMIEFCDLELVEEDQMIKFFDDWIPAQQYIVNEFNEIQNYVRATIDNTEFVWSVTPEMNVISEGIIQSNLRDAGYEIECDGLDYLPLDARDLHTKIYRVDK